jgi:hypothetical protein
LTLRQFKTRMKDWEPIKFCCATCGTRAVVNPEDSHEWGCVECDLRTHSVALYFKPLPVVRPSDN